MARCLRSHISSSAACPVVFRCSQDGTGAFSYGGGGSARCSALCVPPLAFFPPQVQSRLAPSVAHYNAAMKRFGKPCHYKRVSKVSLSKFHAAIQHLARNGVKMDGIADLPHLLCVTDLALAVTRGASRATIVKHWRVVDLKETDVGTVVVEKMALVDEVATLKEVNKTSLMDSLEHIDLSLTLISDLKKAQDDINALKGQQSAQLVLKQQVIDELERAITDSKQWLVIEHTHRLNAEAWQNDAEEKLADKIRHIGVLENDIKALATVHQGKIAKAEAQGKQEAHLYWARAIKEKNALLQEKDDYIKKTEAIIAETNNKWYKEKLMREEFEAGAKKLLHDNAVLVEKVVSPITPDFVPVAPPPSPIDFPTDFKVVMTAYNGAWPAQAC